MSTVVKLVFAFICANVLIFLGLFKFSRKKSLPNPRGCNRKKIKKVLNAFDKLKAKPSLMLRAVDNRIYSRRVRHPNKRHRKSAAYQSKVNFINSYG